MTDQPATTPAADREAAAAWAEVQRLNDLASTLAKHNGDLITDLDEARREANGWLDSLTATLARIEKIERDLDEARVERDEMAELYDATIGDQLRAERVEARALAVKAQTDADDLRARVHGLADKWDADRLNTAIDKEAAAYLLRDLLDGGR